MAGHVIWRRISTMAKSDASGTRLITGSTLRNRLFVIRHGESESNVQNILVSNPEVGVPSYGLTEKGKVQAREASDKLKLFLQSDINFPEKLVVVSSDFKRTRETAEILHAHLLAKTPIRFEKALRERWYGAFDMMPIAIENERKVAELDKDDPSHTKYEIESVMSVVERMSTLVKKLDEEYKDKIFLLVSHLDPLQILITTFLGVPPGDHTSLPLLENCNIRELSDELMQQQF